MIKNETDAFRKFVDLLNRMFDTYRTQSLLVEEGIPLNLFPNNCDLLINENNINTLLSINESYYNLDVLNTNVEITNNQVVLTIRNRNFYIGDLGALIEIPALLKTVKPSWYIKGTINNNNDAHNAFLNNIKTYDVDVDKLVKLKSDYQYFDIEPAEIHAKLILPEITDNTDITIKYGLTNKKLNKKLTAKINPSSYPQEYIKFTADDKMPLGLYLTEDGTINGIVQEEFDPWGFNTTDVIVSYPGAEDKEITINWEYVKPEITADTTKEIKGIAGKNISAFSYTPEIGPSEFYTDKTLFTYSVSNLPAGIILNNNSGTLVISGIPTLEFNGTTTVTISHPHAENKELSIKWNIIDKVCHICENDEGIEHKCSKCRLWMCSEHERSGNLPNGRPILYCTNCEIQKPPYSRVIVERFYR